MRITTFLAAALLVACGDNLEPEEQVIVGSDGGEHDDKGGSDDPVPPRAIEAAIFIETITCVDTIARFEADARYTDDGTAATNIACLWSFDDGTTSSECTGEHQFADAGDHDFVLEVTDLATGANDVVTQTRFFHPPLEVTLEVTSADLSITYSARSNTGGEQVVRVLPEELVIATDPNYPRVLDGTVQVREAGTYTVVYDVEDERGVSEICSAQLVEEIDVACEGDGHVH